MIQATIILLVAHALMPRLRRTSAADRHLFWSAALAAAAIVPVLAVVMPAWSPIWASRLIDALPVSFAALPSWTLPRSPDIVLRATQVDSSTWTPVDWAAAIWMLGSAAVLLRLVAEVLKLRRLIATSRPVVDPHSLRLLSETARALGLTSLPRLLESPLASIPLTWGVGRCQVLLPARACQWQEERLRAVIAHELAHIRRGDWTVHMLAQIACVAYWFHPLFWTAQRALCRESEHAADDEVLGIGLEASAYATHLLEVVRAARNTLLSGRAVVAMARTCHLERRITALLNVSANRRSRSGRMLAVAVAIAILVTPPLAAMTIQPARLYVDVVVQMLDLPPVTSTADVQGPNPMRPAVRSVVNADRASTAQAIVAPAIAEYTTPALYSDQARRRRTEGVVTIALRVDEQGTASNVRVVRGLGDGLDQNALVAVRQWRFRAGTSDGQPVAMDAEVDIEFNLRTEAINELIANDMVTLVGPGITPPKVARAIDMPTRVTGARGTVILDVVLLENGSPKILRILRSLSPQADESAVRHFERWRFSPALRNGVPVKVRMNAEVRFHG